MKNSVKTVISSGLMVLSSAGVMSATAKSQENRISKKSTYVLVHSAFTGPWAMESVAKDLRSRGYKVILPELPAHGNDKTPAKNVQFKDYVNTVVNELDNQNEKVILLGHSFAGTIISEVAEKRPEKIQSLVYLAAALIPSGTSFFENIKDANSVLTQNLVVNNEKGFATVGNEKTHEAYGEDIPLEAFKAAEKFVVPEPFAPLTYKIELTEKNFGRVPRYYIQTLQDKAIPQSLQRKMYTDTPVKQVFTINSSHAPNLSTPVKVASILNTIHAIENSKLTVEKEIKIVKEVELTSKKWADAFNSEAVKGKAKKIYEAYKNDAILQSLPIEFGNATGKDNIRKYWQTVIDSGAKDLIYINRKILVVDESTALLSASWTMNKFKGIITMEKWVKKGSKWFLAEDNFEATEIIKDVN